MNVYMKQSLVLIAAVFFLFFSFIIPKETLATRYDLIAPTETLTRGQPVQFTISIDTQGQTINTGQIGMTFDTQYLQYSSAVPGDAMSQISVDTTQTGKLILTGTNTAGYSGTGNFAVVTYNLIAQAPGSTVLCTLFAPATAPTSPPVTAAPRPTRLPKSGVADTGNFAGLAGLALVIITSGVLFSMRLQEKHSLKKSIHTAHHHKKH